MAYIYKITNDFDKKIYIGKTTRSVELRFIEHFKKTSGSNSYIDNDMANKGLEHFKYEILEECSVEQLSEREKYWIAYYHSYIKDPFCNGNGYNLTPGGDGISLSDEVINQIRKKWEEGKNCSEIANELNLSHSTVYHRIAAYEDYDKQENFKRANQQYWKPVKQYDINGNYLKTFESISQAAKEINVYSTQIQAAIIKHQICHGYRWSYANEELIIGKNTKTVAQIDPKTNEIIKIYEGAREAARQMNVDSSCIIRACQGKNKTSKGFIWRYINE